MRLTSAWSHAPCVLPRLDPYAPELHIETVASRSRTALVHLLAEDDPRSFHQLRNADPRAYVTEPKDMLLAATSDFVGATWQPFASEATLRVPAVGARVYVKVRDGAGNESRVAVGSVDFDRRTALDRAIFLEEDALDAMAAHDWAAARTAIEKSLPLIEQTVIALTKRAHDHQHGKVDPECAEDNEAIAKLVVVGAKKLVAIGQAKEKTGSKAAAVLSDAMKTEVQLADAAAKAGRPL